jgi:hypothetical protein
MGALAWYYFTPYDPDMREAFRALRQREFAAGRYYPAVLVPEFPVRPNSPSPGAMHSSLEDAIQAAGPNGTRSILDMKDVTLDQARRVGLIVPLARPEVLELYQSEHPTHEMIESNMDFFTDLGRGEGIFIIVFKQGTPDELFFAGYSYD